MPAERRVDREAALRVQADGQLVERDARLRGCMVEAVAAVDHQAGVARGARRSAGAVVGRQAGEADRRTGQARGLERAQALGDREAAAAGEVDVLVRHQVPGVLGLRGALGVGGRGGLGLHQDHLRAGLDQSRRARHVQLGLPIAVDRHDHAERRTRAGGEQVVQRPLACLDDHLVAVEVAPRRRGRDAQCLRRLDHLCGEGRGRQVEAVLVLQVGESVSHRTAAWCGLARAPPMGGAWRCVLPVRQLTARTDVALRLWSMPMVAT